jgi:uncharacterized membrane protein YvbJ
VLEGIFKAIRAAATPGGSSLAYLKKYLASEVCVCVSLGKEQKVLCCQVAGAWCRTSRCRASRRRTKEEPGGKRRRLAQHTSPPLSYEIRAIAQHAISLLLSDCIIIIILLYDVQEKFENNTILLKTLKKAVEDKTLEKVGG